MNGNRLYNTLKTIESNHDIVFNLALNQITLKSKMLNNDIVNLIKPGILESKPYDFITSTHKHILSLVDEIKLTNDPEKVVRLRNRLNYYINKMKKGMIKYKIQQEYQAEYFYSVSFLRDDIADYLRVIKRDKKIKQMNDLVNKKSITKEEKNTLTKLIRNEKIFNKKRLVTIPIKTDNINQNTEINQSPKKKAKKNFSKAILKAFKSLLFMANEKRRYSVKKGSLAVCIAISILLQTFNVERVHASNIEEIQDDGPLTIFDSREATQDELENVYKSMMNKNFSNSSDDLVNIEAKEVEIEDVSTEEKQNDMSYTVRERETLTRDQLSSLLNYLVGDNPFGISFKDENEALEYLYNNDSLSYEEKMLVIMARENLSYDEIDTICAGCCAEGGPTYYDETYRVASAIYNRSHTSRWISEFGNSIYTQFACNQFAVYPSGAYKKYLGSMDYDGYKGAIDMFYTRMPSIDYLSFRDKNFEMNIKYEQFMSNGNRYIGHVHEDEWVESEYIDVIEKELKEDSKTLTKKLN